ncbi:hypothetical protein BGX24_006099, partial [Mortierella sp. AD032]
MVSTNMTTNALTLFSLVYGQATSKAFPVDIESNKTIGDLTLWSASHPVIAANKHRP